ncbi:hypothetical protein [Marinactinospora rubrisoli]|uniref:Uncharacterized protein n=1 Tax=Marinactinospora rubrisoli TaxID=2715399 RepID=A0ABW2KLE4_9ACTN
MPDVSMQPKLTDDARKAVAAYASALFRGYGTGEQWLIVAAVSPGGRSEKQKTKDDEEYSEEKVQLRVDDLEVVTGPHADAARKALDAARYERLTAGTLLEDLTG